MQPFHPITETNCRSLVGKPVLIYLYNGFEMYGIVSRVEKNKIILNGHQHTQLKSTSKSTKSTLTKKGKKKPVQPDTPLQSTPQDQLSSFGLIRFGGPVPEPAARPTGPVDIQIDYIAAMFSD